MKPWTFPMPLSVFVGFFWVCPLFALPSILRLSREVQLGVHYQLSRDTGVIAKNGAAMALLGDVDRVQIRTLPGGQDWHDEYRLTLVLKDERKLKIHQTFEWDEIAGLADDLADFLEAPAIRKS